MIDYYHTVKVIFKIIELSLLCIGIEYNHRINLETLVRPQDWPY